METRIFFQMQEGGITEVITFSNEHLSDEEINESFEVKCGGVYKWWRDPVQETSGPTTY